MTDENYPGGAWIVQGDALKLDLRDESVDLIVTSPPYFALRSYTDGGEHYDGQIGSEPTPGDFLVALWRVLDECWRVLKPTGSCWVNLGDKYAGSGGHNNSNIGASSERGPGSYNKAADVPAKSLMGLPWRWVLGATCPDPYRTCYDPGDHHQWVLRAEVVWSKPNGLPESVTDRVRRSHEQWFHLTKHGRYFAAVDEVREPHAETSIARSGRNRFAEDRSQCGVGSPNTLDPTQACNPLGKLPGSVWTIPSEPLRVPERIGVDHFAAYPQEWPRRIILGWSPSGICEACREGRRPVVEKEYDTEGRTTNGPQSIERRHESPGRSVRAVEQASITGYACACPTPDAPTRPAVILDPFGGTGTTAMVARALGRFGVSVDLSTDYNRLAQWRVWRSGHEYKTLARIWAEKNGAMVDGKPKVPAKIKREIEAEMKARKVAQIRQSRALWEQVRR